MKKFEVFWNLPYDSIQEPVPHYTILCLKCGALYNRTDEVEKKCKNCGVIFKNNKITEFYVGKNKIFFGKDLKDKRENLEANK